VSTLPADERGAWVGETAKPSPYDLFILALASLSLVNFVLLLLPITSTTKGVVLAVDAVASIFLLVDFGLRLKRADSRRDYFIREFGWLDFLGSLPFPLLRIFRLWRIVRQIRILRREDGRVVWRDFIRERAQATLLFVVLLVLITVEAGSLGVLWAERHAAGANIRTASDALWWCMATITTIGYGDVFPVSNAGRLVGVWLMIVGVGLFGTFTAFVANAFVSPHAKDSPQAQELRALVRQQQALMTELAAKLSALDARADETRSDPQR
jgi:voltage-gated potassium channel